jgi:fatty-acyl-CoA synthase
MPTLETVWSAFDRAVEATPTATALTDLTNTAESGAGTLSYAALRERAERTSAVLSELGVRRGDTVATLLPTCTAWVEVFLATARLGALLVPLNTRYRSEEVSHLLRLSGARVLVGAAEFEGVNFSGRLAEVAALAGDDAVAVRHFVNVAGDPTLLPQAWEVLAVDALTEHNLATPSAVSRPYDPLIVFGTSGTTSAPKLAVHTHGTTTAHVAAVAMRLGLGSGPAALQVLSLSGTFGFVPFLAGLLVGKPAVLLPIFKLARVLDALRRLDCDLLVAAEGSVRELLDELTPEHAGGLRRMVTAGLHIGDIVESAAALGIEAANVYGSSEVFAFAATSAPGDPAEDRCVPGGRLTAPGMNARVRDPDSGDLLPIGKNGLLELGGDTLFTHYLHNDDASTASRTADGWFRTGDSATMLDERSFRYLARANDTLRLGGYSVSPADVETAIEELAEVAQAQVVGVRDPRTGDDLGVAFVRAEAGADLTADAVLNHCRSRLASFKWPVRVEVVDAYPCTPSANGDKVRRDVLRTTAEQLLRIGNSSPTEPTDSTKEHTHA